MGNRDKKLGAVSESVAALHLRRKDYLILHRNWRSKNGEIDIVALRQRKIVFVEVKGREGTGFFSPWDAITSEKISRLDLLAHQYVKKYHKQSRMRRITHWKFLIAPVYFRIFLGIVVVFRVDLHEIG